MMDERRHSLDIPITKTLLALRRVRSLRDPSTNSMSKLSASGDNTIWDTNIVNSITLAFHDSCIDHGVANGPIPKFKDIGVSGQREDLCNSSELLNGFRSPNGELNSITGCMRGPKQEVVDEKDSLYCSGYSDRGLALTCISPSINYAEGVGSCNEVCGELSRANSSDDLLSTWKNQQRNQTSPYGVSYLESPCLTTPEGLSSSLLIENGDTDYVDKRHGCGMSSCWSGTPRLKGSNIPLSSENQPLLSGEIRDTKRCSNKKALKYLNNQSFRQTENLRSISEKFKPNFFSDLAGQNVVVQSLLNAISSAIISSFYLFHGPRGTGKTSASKIFAAALNCLSFQEDKPCGVCRECIFFYSGRSSDVMEIDSQEINHKNRIRALIKHSTVPPISSRFKVFIIDECHLLQQETWMALLNKSADLPQYVVFLMITPDLNKLPYSAVSCSELYHFPKINEAIIAKRLEKICVEEGLEFEQAALDLIATKSNGSFRDAEMTIEHLSLLGKRITMPLIYELIGIVSDDELLELLDLALSSDSSKTIRKARELMASGIDPTQLTTQLANLIMDILGKCNEGSSEVRRKFFCRHNSEVSVKQLGHALKILSDTEKQLKMSKCQATWLTVALLQFNSVGCSFVDLSDLKSCEKRTCSRDGDFCSRSSASESLKHVATCDCHDDKSSKFGMQDSGVTLQNLWQKAIETCQSNSLKRFLKEGNLSSVCFNQGVAVVQLEFHCRDHVKKAEKSWKPIASSLQSILGCNVEIRIKAVNCASTEKAARIMYPCLRLFRCSHSMCRKSKPTLEYGSDLSDNSNTVAEIAKLAETCSTESGTQFTENCCLISKGATTIRSNEGNALSIQTSLNGEQGVEKQPRFFSRLLSFIKR